jgi:hypothetical protein
MDSLDTFLHQLLHDGRVVFRGRPAPPDGPEDRAAERLARAFAGERLEVAGPLVPFDPRAALAAAELLRQACWALVNHDDRVEALEGRLRMPFDPRSPSHHLSADLTLRYLPQVHRRAKSFDPADPLPALLADVLRRWPLSGVLSDVDDGPATPPDLGGHPGLMLLYAERLARHERPAWRPEGRAFEYVELVLRGLGRGRSPLLLATAAAAGGDGHE